MRDKNRRFRSSPIYPILVKGGDWVDISLVVLVYRCEECHARLKRWNAGVVCTVDPAHKHVIHQREVALIEAQQLADLAQAQESYAIDGDEIIFTGELEL